MGSIGIVTDSTADLRPAVQERLGLGVVPLIINWDGKTFRDKLDLSAGEFYRRLRTSKTLPRTGAPSLAAFESAFREQLKQHEAVVSVNLAAKLSGTYEVARMAAESVDPRRIAVVTGADRPSDLVCDRRSEADNRDTNRRRESTDSCRTPDAQHGSHPQVATRLARANVRLKFATRARCVRRRPD